MKVIIVSSSIPKSPEELHLSFVFDEAYRLSLQGVKVHAIENAKVEDQASSGISFHGVRSSLLSSVPFMLRHLGALPPLGFLRPPWKILDPYRYGHSVSDIVGTEEVDIIHAHFAYPEGFAGLIAKRETGKPLVVTLHGYDILTEPSVGYGLRLGKRLDAIIKKVLKEADAVITASSATFNEASKIGVNGQKLYLIPNGIDLNKFNPNVNGKYIREKLGLNGRFIVFSLRAHEPWKGLEYLIRAIPSVIKYSENIFFIIGGEGSLKKYHKLLSRSLGVEKYVKFTGYIPSKDVPSYYAASDVSVVPSLQEAFGLVVTEAMASCKPVIGSDVGGIPDQITDRYNGFLVKPRDPHSIANKIIFLYEHPEEAREMGLNGRKKAEEKFDIDKKINRIIQLYSEL